MSNFRRFIEPIEDPGYCKLLKDTVDYLDSILIYGEDLLLRINDKGSEKYSDSAINLLLRELLEFLDGFISLFDGSSINVSDVLLRNIFELSLSFMYIFKDEDMIESRALAYDVESIYNKIDYYERLNTDIERFSSDRQIVGSEFFTETNNEELLNRVENLKSMFTKYDEYKKLNEEFEAKIRGNKKPRWYEVHSNAQNIRELSAFVDMEKYYIMLYKSWSTKTHGSAAMSGFTVNGNSPYIKNPKVPSSVSDKLQIVWILMTDVYINLSKYYFGESGVAHITPWYESINNKGKIIINMWENTVFK